MSGSESGLGCGRWAFQNSRRRCKAQSYRMPRRCSQGPARSVARLATSWMGAGEITKDTP